MWLGMIWCFAYVICYIEMRADLLESCSQFSVSMPRMIIRGVSCSSHRLPTQGSQRQARWSQHARVG